MAAKSPAEAMENTSQTPFTTRESFDKTYEALFATFASGRTKDIAWRKWQLKQFWWMVVDNEKLICDAMTKDLNRTEAEGMIAELVPLKDDLRDILQNFEKWAADEKLPRGINVPTLTKSYIRKEPLGVALIIGAWNFPFLLLLQPVLAAIAAGCCVIMKPSELSSASERLLVELVPKYLDSSAVALVTGGPQEITYFLEHRFNHIFFTGSAQTARYVAAAAAKHLTPTVLELGGQAPAIVCKSADIDMAAKRIAFAKFLNGGQICLTVNHVFADPDVYDEFVGKLARWTEEFLKRNNGSLPAIVNDRHLGRLTNLLSKSKGTVLTGGQHDSEKRIIQPTVISNVGIDDSVMSEELFGPICPVIKATSTEAIRYVSSAEHPLAMYIFSNDKKEVKSIMDGTNSGGVTVNDVFMHYLIPGAPFGGVGESGHGYYHGVHGFNSFSHTRIVSDPPSWFEIIVAARYPPYQVPKLMKILMADRVGFKRGETLADQKVGRGRGWKYFRFLLTASVLIGAILAARKQTRF